MYKQAKRVKRVLKNVKRLLKHGRKQAKGGPVLRKTVIVFPFVARLIGAVSYKGKVLDWLSPGGLLNARHSTTGDHHTQKTGVWLLEELQKLEWFAGNGPRLIVCQGAGNTSFR